MSKRKMVAGALMALAVAACGSSETPAPGGSKAAPAAAAAGKSGPAGWNAADACTIIDKADVGAILKSKVTETRLDMANEAGEVSAATSQCVYKLESGGEATLLARWSPIDDNNAAAIATARSVSAKSVAAFTSKPIEDVPGVGKAAFLVPGINQFNVFIDDARMIIITPGTIPDAEAKAAVVALAKKAGA